MALTKTKVQAPALAEALVSKFLRKPVAFTSADLRLDEDGLKLFEEKTKVHLMATLLAAVSAEEDTIPTFFWVRSDIEKNGYLIFEEKKSTAEIAVKNAMRSIHDVVKSADPIKEIAWARNWMEDVGGEMENEIVLHRFARQWIEYYQVVLRALQVFEPAV